MRCSPGAKLLVVIAVALQASCAEPTAPATTETLAVSVVTRFQVAGEIVPKVQLSESGGDVTMRVTRAALCATLVSAGVNRRRDELAIVSRVSAHPGADCIATTSRVVDYQGTVGGVVPGLYVVRVFEAIADGKPRLIHERRMTVSHP